jgi:PBP1b-binding outer membrane lipoprotein LpoB
MVRTFLTVALLAAGCKSESAAKRETPPPTAEQAPAAKPTAAPSAPQQTDVETVRMKEELETLDQQVTAAAGEVATAQTDTDRAAANSKLEELKRQQSALKVKRMRAAVPTRADRAGGSPTAPARMTNSHDDAKQPAKE